MLFRSEMKRGISARISEPAIVEFESIGHLVAGSGGDVLIKRRVNGTTIHTMSQSDLLQYCSKAQHFAYADRAAPRSITYYHVYGMLHQKGLLETVMNHLRMEEGK